MSVRIKDGDNPEYIIKLAQENDVKLWASPEGKLCFIGKFARLTRELQDKIKLHKQVILDHLLAVEGAKKFVQASLFENFTDEDLPPIINLPGAGQEEDLGKNKKVKKKATLDTIYMTITKAEVEILKRIHYSRRLYVRDPESRKYDGSAHYFLGDILKGIGLGQLDVCNSNTAARLHIMFATYSDCPFLNMIDRVWEAAQLKLPWPHTYTPDSWIKGAQDALMRNVVTNEALTRVEGTAIFWNLWKHTSLPQKEEKKHSWFITKRDNTLVDPAWKFYPDSITCYKEE